MYHCRACKEDFATPRRIDDAENDESYEICPYCKSDNFEIKMYVTLETHLNKWNEVTLREEDGKMRKLFMSLDFFKAFQKMNEFRRKYLHNNAPLKFN